MLALGANAWVIALLLPVLHGGARDALDLFAAALPLVALVAGAALLAHGVRPIRRRLAILLLLFVFPVALALALAHRTDLADRDAWGAVGLFAAALSILGYGAVAAEACSRPLTLRTSSAQALTAPLVAVEPRIRTGARRAVLGVATAGALAAGVVAPALGARAELVRAWGDAADEAMVLACVVGASAGAAGLAATIGPRLRAARPGDEPRAGPRIAVAIVLATLALVLYAVLRHTERAW